MDSLPAYSAKMSSPRPGLSPKFVQVNNSLSAKKGTLRGMHYQLPPRAEVKLVRCVRGALWDAILDLRPDSPTFGKSFGAELSADNRLMMYVPRGFAHAILTLTDDTEALYLVSEFYGPGRSAAYAGMIRSLRSLGRSNRPRFHPRTTKWPDFDPAFHGIEQLRGL